MVGGKCRPVATCPLQQVHRQRSGLGALRRLVTHALGGNLQAAQPQRADTEQQQRDRHLDQPGAALAQELNAFSPDTAPSPARAAHAIEHHRPGFQPIATRRTHQQGGCDGRAIRR